MPISAPVTWSLTRGGDCGNTVVTTVFTAGMGTAAAVIPWGWGQRLRYTRGNGEKVLPADSRNQKRTGPL